MKSADANAASNTNAMGTHGDSGGQPHAAGPQGGGGQHGMGGQGGPGHVPHWQAGFTPGYGPGPAGPAGYAPWAGYPPPGYYPPPYGAPPPGYGAGAGAAAGAAGGAPQDPLGTALGDMAEQNGLGMLKNFLNFNDDEFWKGALVGAAVVLVMTNENLRNSLIGGAAKAAEAMKSGLAGVAGAGTTGDEGGDDTATQED